MPAYIINSARKQVEQLKGMVDQQNAKASAASDPSLSLFICDVIISSHSSLKKRRRFNKRRLFVQNAIHFFACHHNQQVAEQKSPFVEARAPLKESNAKDPKAAALEVFANILYALI